MSYSDQQTPCLKGVEVERHLDKTGLLHLLLFSWDPTQTVNKDLMDLLLLCSYTGSYHRKSEPRADYIVTQ